MLVWCCVVSALLLGPASANPAPLQSEQRPLSLVSELPARLDALPARLQDALPARLDALPARLGALPARLQDARLPLPSSQDLDAIKKVAQILVTLGQQVIPGIIGEPVPAPGSCEPAGGGDDVPNDPVTIDRQPASLA